MHKYESLKKNLENFIKKNKNFDRKQVFKQFSNLGAPKRSLNRWLERLEIGGSLNRKSGSGRPTKIATNPNIKTILNKFNHRSGCSQRRVAKQLNTSQQYVSFIIKKYTNMRCLKKSKKPLMTIKQKKAARPKCRKMSQEFAGLDFILDDESYFTLSNSSLSGNDRFYSDDLEKTPDDVKNKYKAKYEEKVLCYLAISPRGSSKALFFKSGLAVNQYVYKDECLAKSLVPFIKQQYPDGGYVFWPDLASSHYAKTVQEYLNAQNVHFVPKNINPANVPKVRPIEDFWAVLKQKVYEGNWSAKNSEQLLQRIKWALPEVNIETFQKICTGVHKRLCTAAKHGLKNL